jgi:hypothetical protein
MIRCAGATRRESDALHYSVAPREPFVQKEGCLFCRAPAFPRRAVTSADRSRPRGQRRGSEIVVADQKIDRAGGIRLLEVVLEIDLQQQRPILRALHDTHAVIVPNFRREILPAEFGQVDGVETRITLLRARQAEELMAWSAVAVIVEQSFVACFEVLLCHGLDEIPVGQIVILHFDALEIRRSRRIQNAAWYPFINTPGGTKLQGSDLKISSRWP